MERVDAVIDEVGVDAFVAALRITVEDVDAEVCRRINELADDGPVTSTSSWTAR